MGDLVFQTDRTIEATPAEIFTQIGTRAAGWLFGLTCDRIAVGSVVTFAVPGLDGALYESTGRLLDVVADRRLVIAQETPWAGVITLTLEPDGRSTRARLRVSLGQDCVPWFLPVADQTAESEPTAGDVRLGLMVSLSGSAGLLGRAAINAADLAVSEINDSGGILGRRVSISVADDRTRAAVAREHYSHLTEGDRTHAVVAMVTSQSLAAMEPIARRRQGLLLHAPLTETVNSTGTVFRLGERPQDQLAHSMPALMRDSGGRGWFILGNDYSWPRTVGRVARRIAHAHHGLVLGERYLPMGQRDFDSVYAEIQGSGADLVVSALVGRDAVTFERGFHAAGLRQRCRTIAVLMDDSVREHIGDQAAAGIWSVLDRSPGQDRLDSEFRRTWTRRYGQFAPPPSRTAVSVYDAVHLYARAAAVARSLDPMDVARSLRSGKTGASRMLSRAAGLICPTDICEAVPGGFLLREPAV